MDGDFKMSAGRVHPIPDDVLTDHMAVLAKTGAGKTYGAKGIVERLARMKRRICIVDPKDAWWGLKSSADGKSAGHPFIVFGGPHAEINALRDAEGKDLKKDIPLYRTSGGTTRLLVFFDFDKAELKNESKPELNRGVEFLKSNPGIRIEIAGHTDSVGDASYNTKLSQQRAEAVRQYFITGGIEGGRIQARGYGEAQPTADNSTEEGRARNRRVEMRVMDGAVQGATPAQPRR